MEKYCIIHVGSKAGFYENYCAEIKIFIHWIHEDGSLKHSTNIHIFVFLEWVLISFQSFVDLHQFCVNYFPKRNDHVNILRTMPKIKKIPPNFSFAACAYSSQIHFTLKKGLMASVQMLITFISPLHSTLFFSFCCLCLQHLIDFSHSGLTIIISDRPRLRQYISHCTCCKTSHVDKKINSNFFAIAFIILLA